MTREQQAKKQRRLAKQLTVNSLVTSNVTMHAMKLVDTISKLDVNINT